MKLLLPLLAAVLALVIGSEATLEQMIHKAHQIERLQSIVDRIMSPESGHRRPHHQHPPRLVRPTTYPGTPAPPTTPPSGSFRPFLPHAHPFPPPPPPPFMPQGNSNNKPSVVNLHLKISPKADSDDQWRAGGVSVYQKDDERERTGELEAHWHTVRKEVTIDGRSNVTKVRSLTDDGEIRKSTGADSSRKWRRFKAGEIKGHKVVQAVRPAALVRPRVGVVAPQAAAAKQPAVLVKEPTAGQRALEARERQQLDRLMKKYMTAEISKIGAEGQQPIQRHPHQTASA